MNKLLSVADVMERLGKQGACGRVWVCRELKAGRLKGEKVGGAWLTTESALKKYLAEDKYKTDNGRRNFGKPSRRAKNSAKKEQDKNSTSVEEKETSK